MPFAMAVPFTFCIISGIKSVIFTDSLHLLLLLLASCVVRVCVCVYKTRGKRERERVLFVLWMLFTFLPRCVREVLCASNSIPDENGEKRGRSPTKRKERVNLAWYLAPFSSLRFFLVRKRKSTVDLAPPQPHAPNTKLSPEDMGKC